MNTVVDSGSHADELLFVRNFRPLPVDLPLVLQFVFVAKGHLVLNYHPPLVRLSSIPQDCLKQRIILCGKITFLV